MYQEDGTKEIELLGAPVDFQREDDWSSEPHTDLRILLLADYLDDSDKISQSSTSIGYVAKATEHLNTPAKGSRKLWKDPTVYHKSPDKFRSPSTPALKVTGGENLVMFVAKVTDYTDK